jgi:glucose-6-phosphate 1-epimerase
MKSRVGPGGLDVLQVDRPFVDASVFLQGAHLASWKPPGQTHDLLFVSSRSAFGPGKAVRGGVPVCFPWFGPMRPELGFRPSPQAPMHGVARTTPWKLVESCSAGQSVMLRLAPVSYEPYRAWTDAAFETSIEITLGQTLEVTHQVTNSGPAPMRYETALHTYFRVGDVTRIRIEGLGGTDYFDKTQNFARLIQREQTLSLVDETDRVYVDTDKSVTIIDPVLDRRIVNHKRGSSATVVWNPWEAKSVPMTGLAPDEWKQFVCVETASCNKGYVTLEPGRSHATTMIVEVTPL